MIKFHTTKTFAALESGKTELVPTREAEPIQITYDILGFGPRFKLIIKMISSKLVIYFPDKKTLIFLKKIR